jgi:hypothetical protein
MRHSLHITIHLYPGKELVVPTGHGAGCALDPFSAMWRGEKSLSLSGIELQLHSLQPSAVLSANFAPEKNSSSSYFILDCYS